MSEKSVYEAPALSVDCVIFQLIDNELCVLLIKRANEPFKGKWALPGGYNPKGETTVQAVHRVVAQKAGVQLKDLGLVEQIFTFDTVARDPRGHAVSVTYMGLGSVIFPKANKTTHNPQFFAVNDLPELAFDHTDIIRFAVDCLIRKLAETNAVFALLPRMFTLSQLQTAYEAVLGHPLDKRNFRKKFISYGLLADTDTFLMEGAHRPARLYKFAKAKLTDLDHAFD